MEISKWILIAWAVLTAIFAFAWICAAAQIDGIRKGLRSLRAQDAKNLRRLREALMQIDDLKRMDDYEYLDGLELENAKLKEDNISLVQQANRMASMMNDERSAHVQAAKELLEGYVKTVNEYSWFRTLVRNAALNQYQAAINEIGKSKCGREERKEREAG